MTDSGIGATLTDEAVEAVFLDCLLDDAGHEGAVIPEGIVHRFAFDPERLEVQRDEIEGWISELPSEFLADGAGGWSFLNLCNRADGEQWTSLHLRMEQFVAMAEGLGLASFLMPREMWSVLPGGMPYIVFRRTAESVA